MKKRIWIIALIFGLVLSLTACGGGNKANNSKGAEGNTEAKGNFEPGREDGELDVCIASEPESIDPALNTTVDGATMIQHLSEGLIKWDNDGNGTAKLVPAQAQSWDKSEDGLTWTFHLRDGIKFNDGTPVTANDFVYSWNRLVKPETTAQYEYMLDMVDGYDEKVLKVEAPDEKTFVVHLKNLCPYFEEICAFPSTYPVKKDVVENNDQWTLSPETYISNGPYKMESWDHNQTIKMVKNPEYYDADSYTAEKINFHLKDDHNAIYASYRSGELDFIRAFAPTEEIPNLIASGELNVRPQIGTYFVCFNNKKAPFDNPDVRKAFSLAIDRNFIIEQVTQAGQVPAPAYVPNGIYDAKGTEGEEFRKVGGEYYSVKAEDYEKNCEEARKLLEKAGYKDGKGFPEVTYLYNTNDAHKAIGEALQNMWQQVLGVTVTLSNQEWNVFINERQQGNYEIARHGWVADFNDPMSFLDMWLTGGGNNDAKYENPEYDKLIKEAKATADQGKRMELMHKAEDILIKDDGVVAPIYFYTSTDMLKPNVKGLYYVPLGFYFFGKTSGF